MKLLRLLFPSLFASKSEPETGESLQEFSFIWYKKLQTKDKTVYTQPFRTKIKAKNHKQAVDKLTDHVMGSMKLVIVEESNFEKTDLSKIQKGFDGLQKEMDAMMRKFGRHRST